MKPPITAAALSVISHSWRRLVRPPWLQQVFESSVKLNNFFFNLTKCAVCSRGRINRATYFFPCCIWSWINTIAHTGKLNVIQIGGSLWPSEENRSLYSSLLWSWTTRLSLSIYVISTFFSVRMVLKSAASRRITRVFSCCYMHVGLFTSCGCDGVGPVAASCSYL